MSVRFVCVFCVSDHKTLRCAPLYRRLIGKYTRRVEAFHLATRKVKLAQAVSDCHNLLLLLLLHLPVKRS